MLRRLVGHGIEKFMDIHVLSSAFDGGGARGQFRQQRHEHFHHCPRLTQVFTMVHNGFHNGFHNGSQWFTMVHNGSQWFTMVHIHSHRFKKKLKRNTGRLDLVPKAIDTIKMSPTTATKQIDPRTSRIIVPSGGGGSALGGVQRFSIGSHSIGGSAGGSMEYL